MNSTRPICDNFHGVTGAFLNVYLFLCCLCVVSCSVQSPVCVEHCRSLVKLDVLQTDDKTSAKTYFRKDVLFCISFDLQISNLAFLCQSFSFYAKLYTYIIRVSRRMCRRVQDPASVQLGSSCQASQQAPKGISSDTRCAKDMLLTDRAVSQDCPMTQCFELYRIDRSLKAFTLNFLSYRRLTSGPLHKILSCAAYTEVMLCPHCCSPWVWTYWARSLTGLAADIHYKTGQQSTTSFTWIISSCTPRVQTSRLQLTDSHHQNRQQRHQKSQQLWPNGKHERKDSLEGDRRSQPTRWEQHRYQVRQANGNLGTV